MIDKWQRVGTAHIALDAQNCPVGLLKSVGSIKTADGTDESLVGQNRASVPVHSIGRWSDTTNQHKNAN